MDHVNPRFLKGIQPDHLQVAAELVSPFFLNLLIGYQHRRLVRHGADHLPLCALLLVQRKHPGRFREGVETAYLPSGLQGNISHGSPVIRLNACHVRVAPAQQFRCLMRLDQRSRRVCEAHRRNGTARQHQIHCLCGGRHANGHKQGYQQRQRCCPAEVRYIG